MGFLVLAEGVLEDVFDVLRGGNADAPTHVAKDPMAGLSTPTFSICSGWSLQEPVLQGLPVVVDLLVIADENAGVGCGTPWALKYRFGAARKK